MSGMKISLDAAMRARDVSSPGPIDSSTVDSSTVDSNTVDDVPIDGGTVDRSRVGDSAGTADLAEAPAGAAPPAARTGVGDADQPGHDQHRRRARPRPPRRARLRPGRPT
jgi:hypothetical protein